jgi:uncharacterized protein (TIGR03435 family)
MGYYPTSVRVATSLIALMLAALNARAQSRSQSDLTSAVETTAAPLSFAAASIKVNHTGNNGRLAMTPGRINFSSVTLEECLTAAYETSTYQIVGPASLKSERYDIIATTGRPAPDGELRAMLKNLLADRFKLRAHLETRELPAYRLVATRNGPKLTRAASDQPEGYVLDGGAVVFHGTSMAAFAEYLSHRGPVGSPVLDGTGINGLFDFKLNLFEVRPDMPLDALKRAYYEWDQGSSIFTDLQEQLGLRLQPEKAPFSVVVVDFVAKPSED